MCVYIYMYSFIHSLRRNVHNTEEKERVFLKNMPTWLDNPNNPWDILRRAPPRGYGAPCTQGILQPEGLLGDVKRGCKCSAKKQKGQRPTVIVQFTWTLLIL